MPINHFGEKLRWCVDVLDEARRRAAAPPRRRATTLLQRTDESTPWEARLNSLGHAVQGWAYDYLLAPKADKGTYSATN